MTGLSAQVNEIPLGIEAVTGIRTDYVHRGFDLTSTALDFQLEAEISLSNESFLNIGAWYLSGDDDFSETGAFIDYRRELSKKLTLGATLTYRNYDQGPLESGLEIGFFGSYALNDAWDLKSELAFDFETSGLYGETSLRWSYVLTKSAFLNFTGGISYTSDYYERDGLNDAFSRLSLTYAISDSVAFTPFIGSSISLDQDEGDDTAFGGLLFEVIF